MKKYFLTLAVCAGSLVPGAAFAASLSSTAIYPSATVSPGVRVSFIVQPSGFSVPAYWVTDSFGGGANNSNIDSSGSFSWTPNTSEIGTHVITIAASDSQGDTATLSQTIDVLSGPAVSVAATSTATVGYPLALSVTSSGLINPTFSVGDSFRSSSLRTTAVDYTGTLQWTPLPQDIGTHTVSVTAKDSYGNSTTTSFVVDIVPVGGIPAAAVVPATAATSSAATTTATTTTLSVTGSTVTGTLSTAPSTPATSAHTFAAFLGVGSMGNDVTALQQLLTRLGFYTGPVTGYFGNLTRAGLMAYQTAHGIDAVGYAGPLTRASLSTGK